MDNANLDKELMEIAASYVQRPYTPDILLPRPGELPNDSRVCNNTACESVSWLRAEDRGVFARDTLSGAVQDV